MAEGKVESANFTPRWATEVTIPARKTTVPASEQGKHVLVHKFSPISPLKGIAEAVSPGVHGDRRSAVKIDTLRQKRRKDRHVRIVHLARHEIVSGQGQELVQVRHI